MAFTDNMEHLEHTNTIICVIAVVLCSTRCIMGWPMITVSDLRTTTSSIATESSKLQDFHNLTDNINNDFDNRTGKVLNFFPIPVSEDCLSNDKRRIGTCLNTYECRILEGKSYGPCALGFGVCCVFTVSCGREISNNGTYFLSPRFPDLMQGTDLCTVRVKKIAPEISQLRLDFIHFNLGQPNRRTGVCDSDLFMITGGTGRDMKLCGQNSGMHVYYDVDDVNETITIMMNLTKENTYRMWEVRVTQIEFTQRAPAGCLQYYTEPRGIIQTMNFGDNGRHLADQDYLICMRPEENMCSIAYEPCNSNSFRIGPEVNRDPGSGDGIPSDSIPNDGIPSDGISSDGVLNDVVPIEDDTRECEDKIVMPCDSEELIMPKESGNAMCDLLHCGTSFCAPDDNPCRIESSTKPFNIRVQFGPGDREESPEDNLGMCLRYEQLPCVP